MQEYWESYVKVIDGHKGIISFNAGVADYVPDMDYMYVGFVKVKLNDPKEDGSATEEEANDVGFIEDRLEMESLRWRSGKYIGRIISNGEVNFIYYLKLDFEWKNTVESAMNEFPNYVYEFGSRVDTEWEVYQKLLFPNIKEWQIIVNHHACDNLLKEGDNLRIERAIEHKAFFKDSENRKKFIDLIEKEGFKSQKEMDVPYNGDIMHGVQFYRLDSVFFYNIDELTMHMIDLSNSCDGQYDGWECSLVKI